MDKEYLKDDSDLEEEFDALKDFRACGKELMESLLEGEDVDDELYVRLIVAKLRMTFPCKTK